MAGTRQGAAKARAAALRKNPNHFSDIAKLVKHHSGTFKNKSLASSAGAKGGRASPKHKTYTPGYKGLVEAILESEE